MIEIARVRRFMAGLAAAVVLATAAPVAAQEISPSHLAAARSALAAVRVTDQFDAILPAAAQSLKAEMIQKDPNLEDLIVQTVDEKTLELAKRRADLETEAANVYARAFTEEELKAIAAFYQSPAGVKLLEQGAGVTRQVVQSAEIWQRGIARDLAQSVAETFEAAAPRPEAPAAAETPAQPAQ